MADEGGRYPSLTQMWINVSNSLREPRAMYK